MEPFTWALLLAAVFMRYVGEDAAYALRGKPNPRKQARHAERMAKLRAGQPTLGQAAGVLANAGAKFIQQKVDGERRKPPRNRRYGVRGAVADAWADAMWHATEKRRKRYTDKATKEVREKANANGGTGQANPGTGAAGQRWTTPAGAQTTPGQQTGTSSQDGTGTSRPGTGAGDAGTSTGERWQQWWHSDPAGTADEKPGTGGATNARTSTKKCPRCRGPQFVEVCRWCGWNAKTRSTDTSSGPSSRDHYAAAPRQEQEPVQATAERIQPDPPPPPPPREIGPAPLALPAGPAPAPDPAATPATGTTPTGRNTMTEIAQTPDLSGETIDPESAHLFAEGIGRLAAMLQAKIEGARGDLAGVGVSGEPLACLDQMIEASTTLQTTATQAQQYFKEHLAVQESVLSTPHVGGDAYLRGGN